MNWLKAFNIKIFLLSIFFLACSFADYYGDQYFNNGNYYEALKHYQTAWKKTPDDQQLQTKINTCLFLIKAEEEYGKGNYEAAAKLYHSVPREALPWARVNRIDTIQNLQTQIENALQHNDYQRALAGYEQILQINPEDMNTQALKNNISLLAEQKSSYRIDLAAGRWEQAAQKINGLWSKDPKNLEYPPIIENLEFIYQGDDYTKQGEYAKALQNYEQAALYFKNNPALQNRLEKANTLFKIFEEAHNKMNADELEEAVMLYHKAVLLAEDNSYPLQVYNKSIRFKNNLSKAKNLLLNKQINKAEKILIENQADFPDNALNQYYLRLTQFILERQKANDQRFLDTNFQQLQTLEQLNALITSVQDQEDPAFQEKNIGWEIVKTRNSGQKAFNYGDYQTAQTEFFKLLTYNPYDKNAKLWLDKAKKAGLFKTSLLSALAKNNQEEAIANFKKLREINPRELSSDYRLPVE